MTAVACVEALVLLAVVFLLTRHHSKQEQAWTEERRELLTRIQKPDYVPLRQSEPLILPDAEPDEYDKVGMIAEFLEAPNG